MADIEFRDKDAFFDYYLLEHSNPICRGLHYFGTITSTFLWAFGIVSGQWILLLTGLVFGYAMAWVGHFFFEHNKPASFKYPWISFKADYRMLACFLGGNITNRMTEARNRLNQQHAKSVDAATE